MKSTKPSPLYTQLPKTKRDPDHIQADAATCPMIQEHPREFHATTAGGRGAKKIPNLRAFC